MLRWENQESTAHERTHAVSFGRSVVGWVKKARQLFYLHLRNRTLALVASMFKQSILSPHIEGGYKSFISDCHMRNKSFWFMITRKAHARIRPRLIVSSVWAKLWFCVLHRTLEINLATLCVCVFEVGSLRICHSSKCDTATSKLGCIIYQRESLLRCTTNNVSSG